MPGGGKTEDYAKEKDQKIQAQNVGAPDTGVGVEGNQNKSHPAENTEKTAVEKTPASGTTENSSSQSDEKEREE